MSDATFHNTPENLRQLAEKIESGEYYRDAREWHYDKYQLLVVERSFCIVITIIATLTVIGCIVLMQDFLPLVRTFPIHVKITNSALDYVRLSRVATLEEEPNQALMQDLVEEYVIKREEYKHDFFESNVNILRALTTSSLMKEYEAVFSLENPESPRVKYGQEFIRQIEIIPGTYRIFTQENDRTVRPGERKATFQFNATERSTIGDITSRWQCEVFFVYNNITYDKKEKRFLPLKFEVTGYNVSKIE